MSATQTVQLIETEATLLNLQDCASRFAASILIAGLPVMTREQRDSASRNLEINRTNLAKAAVDFANAAARAASRIVVPQ
jgi:hypothetical protein